MFRRRTLRVATTEVDLSAAPSVDSAAIDGIRPSCATPRPRRLLPLRSAPYNIQHLVALVLLPEYMIALAAGSRSARFEL